MGRSNGTRDYGYADPYYPSPKSVGQHTTRVVRQAPEVIEGSFRVIAERTLRELPAPCGKEPPARDEEGGSHK